MPTAPHIDIFSLFFFNHTATTEIYTLSLHDALPISAEEAIILDAVVAPGHDGAAELVVSLRHPNGGLETVALEAPVGMRSEEHTSELQSLRHLVCRLLLEKKKRQKTLGIISYESTYR